MFSSCTDLTKSKKIVIKDAYFYLPLGDSQIVAAYLSIKNKKDSVVTLDKIICPLAERASFHETTYSEEGKVFMKHLQNISLEPHTTLDFKPGSKHIMIEGINKQLQLGDQFNCKLHTNISTLEILFEVK